MLKMKESSKTEKQTQGHKTAKLMHIFLRDLARENKKHQINYLISGEVHTTWISTIADRSLHIKGWQNRIRIQWILFSYYVLFFTYLHGLESSKSSHVRNTKFRPSSKIYYLASCCIYDSKCVDGENGAWCAFKIRFQHFLLVPYTIFAMIYLKIQCFTV